MKKLLLCGVVSVTFIVAELVGGYYSGSIAIMADAAHLASDLIGFAISMISLKLA